MNQHDATTSARSDLEAWRETVWRSRFDGDPFFDRLLRRHLGARYAECGLRLRRVADETGPRFNELVMESNPHETLPLLRRHTVSERHAESL
jgi:hypothetical protein